MNYEESTARRKDEVEGLPSPLPAGTIAVLYGGATRVALAADDVLTTYTLDVGSTRRVGCRAGEHRVCGRVTAMAESGLGLLVAVESDGRTELLLLRDCELVPVLQVPGGVTALAAAGPRAYVALAGEGCAPRLVVVHLRQRTIEAERPLEHGSVTLAVDRTGQQLAVSDARRGQVRSLDSDLKPLDERPQAPTGPATPVKNPYLRHDVGCCCGCCQGAPSAPHPGDQPDPGHPGGDDGHTDDPAGDRPGDDYYWPAYVPARVELIKSITPASQIVFDGRESLTLDVRPRTGGAPGKQVTLRGFALGFERESTSVLFEVKFLGTEALTLSVTLPDGSNQTLSLAFTAKAFDFANESAIPTRLGELETYLDGLMHAAETGAGIGTRLFAKPKARRIRQVGGGFGRLLVTFDAATLSGNRLRIAWPRRGIRYALGPPHRSRRHSGRVARTRRRARDPECLGRATVFSDYNARPRTDRTPARRKCRVLKGSQPVAET